MATVGEWPAAREMEKSESIQEAIRLLGRISVIKFKLLFAAVAAACRTHANPFTDAPSKAAIAKYNDTSVFVDDDQFWCCVMAIEHIYSSAVKHAIPPADLDVHMQQLGLPREHAAKLAQVHGEHLASARQAYAERVPTMRRAIDVDGTIDEAGVARISLRLENGDTETMLMDKCTLERVIEDLQRIDDHFTQLGVIS